jgi:hypothetical protein
MSGRQRWQPLPSPFLPQHGHRSGPLVCMPIRASLRVLRCPALRANRLQLATALRAKNSRKT